MEQQTNWMPLQSNPQVINQYMKKLGMNTNKYQICDVISLEQQDINMVPKPVLGVIFLYPLTQNQKQYIIEQEKNLQIINQQQLFFMKQYAHNACGTISLFHVIFNNMKDTSGNLYLQDLVQQGSFIFQKNNQWKGKKPQIIGKEFQQTQELQKEHKIASNQGISQCRNQVNTHFISFVNYNNNLYELDGRKNCPIKHGSTNKQNLLKDSIKVIKKFIQRDPQNMNFTIMALTKKYNSE